MTPATATPSCSVIRSSRDTPPAGPDGPDAAVSGRELGLAGLAPLPTGEDGWRGGLIGGPPRALRLAAAPRPARGRRRPWPDAARRHPRPSPRTLGGGSGTRAAAGSAPAAGAPTPAAPARG